MGRNLSSIVKQSRREGFALHPKAHKYLIKKSGIPGQHGSGGRRPYNSNQYAIQLREKQKIKRLYGLLEKQFAKLCQEAIQKQGPAGENTLIALESRLDNAVYRAGFAISRQAARQLVSHKHWLLNGQPVNIASLRLKVGDSLTLRPKSQKNNYFKFLNDLSPAPSQIPSWLTVDRKKFSFSVKQLPVRTDIVEEIDEQLLVEYYSR